MFPSSGHKNSVDHTVNLFSPQRCEVFVSKFSSHPFDLARIDHADESIVEIRRLFRGNENRLGTDFERLGAPSACEWIGANY